MASRRQPSSRRQWRPVLASAVLIGAVIVLLQVLAGAGLVSAFLVPSPAEVVARLPSLFAEERLLARLAETGMAVVGAIYSVDRFVRTPEQVTAALFRDPRQPGEKAPQRPEPVGKHVWASLSEAADGNQSKPIKEVFGWRRSRSWQRLGARSGRQRFAAGRDRSDWRNSSRGLHLSDGDRLCLILGLGLRCHLR